jgi:flagellar basal-body rod protein FlgG
MLKALYTAASGMRSQQTQVDVIANNLANVNTAGFKKSDARFEDLLYVNVKQPGAANKDGSTMAGLQLGSGSQLVATARSFESGALIQTGNPLDLAISGNGFFELQGLDGTRVFTRDGSFLLDRDGNIVNHTGMKLVPPVGAVPQGAQATDVTISGDGTVSVRVGDQIQELGQITLVTFPNAAGLSSEGGNLFKETPASGTPTTAAPAENGAGQILQGNLERSNVDIATELINLILAQRAYEVNTKAIATSDQMLQSANQLAR